MSVKAKVKIEKSFEDEVREFEKEWADGDYEEFFQLEGAYLDRLCKILIEHGKIAEGYTVTYTITTAKGA